MLRERPGIRRVVAQWEVGIRRSHSANGESICSRHSANANGLPCAVKQTCDYCRGQKRKTDHISEQEFQICSRICEASSKSEGFGGNLKRSVVYQVKQPALLSPDRVLFNLDSWSCVSGAQTNPVSQVLVTLAFVRHVTTCPPVDNYRKSTAYKVDKPAGTSELQCSFKPKEFSI